MLSSRISKKLLWCVVSICGLLTISVVEGSENFQASLDLFMSEIPAVSSRQVRERIISGLINIDKGMKASYLSYGGNIYSLVTVPVPEDSEADVSFELEISAQGAALLEAQSRLAFFLGQDGIDRKLFRYDDALAEALLKYYKDCINDKKLRGVETAASSIEHGKFAAGLAWLSLSTAEILSAEIPQSGTLDDDYCRFLYRRRALILFKAGRYEEALPVFRNIHDFRWSDTGAYLDASECFLRTGKPEDCIKLLNELIASLEDKMTSAELRRSGNLFREAGDKEAARDSFIRARRKYHEENKQGRFVPHTSSVIGN